MPDWTTVSYPIMGGVDTKVAGEVLPAPRLQVAENVYSDRTGSLRRRYGRTALASADQAGATITGWAALRTYQDRLLGFTSTKLYEYSEGDSRWTSRGSAASWRETTMPVTAPSASSPTATIGANASDVAVIDGWKLYAYDLYETVGANTGSKLYVTLFDLHGGRYVSDFQLSTNTGVAVSSGVRVVAHGSRFYVIYRPLNVATTLSVFIVDTTSAVTLAASFAAASVVIDATMIGGVFDAEENTTYGPFVAYADAAASNTIRFGFLDTSGALVNVSTTSSTSDATHIAVDVASGNAMHAVCWTRGFATDVYAALRSFNGAAWTATATSGALNAGAVTPVHLACKFDSPTKIRVVFDGDVPITLPCVQQVTYTTAGATVSGTGKVARSYLASKPFATPLGTCFWVASPTTPAPTVVAPVTASLNASVQPTMFLMCVNSSGGGGGDASLVGIANQGINATITSTVQIPRVATAGGLCYVPTFFYTRKSTPLFLGVTGFHDDPIFDLTGNVVAMREVAIDTTNVDAYGCVEDGGSLLVPSAFLGYFDGRSVVEVGFTQYVDTITLTPSNGAGALDSSADYFYRVVPEWTNAQGEREQGTDAGPVKVTMGAADDTVALVINTLPWTLKQAWTAGSAMVDRTALVFAIYRTEGNPASQDDPHYRVGSVKNVATNDTVTFTDLVSDAVAITKEQLYADLELSNLGPAPGFILSAGNGRVLVAGLPDDPSLIVHSKTRGHGVPLAFHPALQIQMPLDAGAIVSTAVLDEQIVVFTSSTVFRVVGDGLTNTGVGSGYAPPVVVVAAEGGAVSHRSTSVTSIGLVYQSLRGIMLFDPSLQGAYLGAPLEGLGIGGYAVGVVTEPARQLIHVAFSSLTAVYDYYHKQWYRWTHHSDGPTCLWVDRVVALQDDVIQYGDANAWKDDTRDYTMTVTLGWQRAPTGMLGDISFRRVAIVGHSIDTHYLDVRLAQDYDATTTQTLDDTVSSAGVLRRRLRIARQKSNSIQVTVRDAILDVYGADVVQATAGLRLFEVSLEVGLRSRRPSSRRGPPAPGGGGI